MEGTVDTVRDREDKSHGAPFRAHHHTSGDSSLCHYSNDEDVASTVEDIVRNIRNMDRNTAVPPPDRIGETGDATVGPDGARR